MASMMTGLLKKARGVGHVELDQLPEPEPGPGEVKIEVKSAGICGTDIHLYYDHFPCTPPVVLGHDVSWTGVATGEGADRFKPGDRVMSETYAYTCGHCRFCLSGCENLCPERRSLGSEANGAFTRFMVVRERNVHLLPEGISFLAGALTEPLACVVHSATECTVISPGDVVVVSGPGAIGLLTMQVAKASGATVVVCGLERDEKRLKMAEDWGADVTINVEKEDPRANILEMSNNEGADVVFEASGSGASAQACLRYVRRGGCYTQIGLVGKPITWEIDDVVYQEVQVTGGFASTPSSYVRALELMRCGLVSPEPLVSDALPLAEWERGFDIVEHQKGLKVVLEP